MDISRLLKKIGPSRLHTQLVLGIAGILVVLMSLLVIVLVNRQKKFFLKLNHDRAFSLSNHTCRHRQFLCNFLRVGGSPEIGINLQG